MKKNDIEYDGFGKIEEYFDKYLLHASIRKDHGFDSYFIDLNTNKLYVANPQLALRFYKDKSDTSAEKAMNTILAINPYNEVLIKDVNDIPHSKYNKNGHGMSFKEYIEKNGINICYPSEIYKTDNNILVKIFFTYCETGGEVAKYELLCKDTRIVSIRKYVLGQYLGDYFLLE